MSISRDSEAPDVVGSNAAGARLLSLLVEAERKRRNAAHTILPRERRDTEIPLSFAQERLWFLDQVGLVGAAYNVPLALRLFGRLDQAALERSFTELVSRHEILRTRFEVKNGAPCQVIEAHTPFKLQHADLSDIADGAERERQLQSWIEQELLHRFDLSVGPLIRVVLLRLAAEEHALLVTMHHIVSDGWSIGVLVRELSALYAASVRHERCPLSALKVQYADYAVWQRRWFQGEVLQNQLRYWTEQLAGAPQELRLPTDRPRPKVETFRGAVCRFRVPGSLVAAAKSLAREEGATLFMVALATFQLLLSRWTGQRDVVVGSPIAGRRHHEVEGLIGFFVNTLVLRTEVSSGLSARQLVQRVKATTLGAYAYQDLPFETLVSALRPERNLTRQPLFQVMLAVQNFPEEQLDLAGIRWKWTNLEFVTSHFDLTLYLYDAPDGMTGVIEYATDLFDATTIERLSRQFLSLLREVTARPDSDIDDLDLLDEAERNQLLIGWNDTRTTYPRDSCVHDLFVMQVDRTPDALAVVGPDGMLSYAELNARANRLAHYLRHHGVEPEKVVAVCLERSVSMIVSFLAILKSGGAYLPLDPDCPAERMAFMLDEAQAFVIVTDEQFAARVPSHGRTLLLLDRDAALMELQPDSNPIGLVNAENLAYVLYTSGSTGRPKAVAVVHRNIMRLLIGTDYIDIKAHDVFLHLAAPSFDASTFEVWGALLHGAKLVLYPEHDIDLEQLQRVLEENRVTVLWLTAGLFHRVIDERPDALKSLKWLLAGGDALSVSHVKRALEHLPGCRLINGYGPTEATTFSVCYQITDPAALKTSVPIGRPIANTHVYVLDERMHPVPIGLPGELYIGGDGVARGYLNSPERTAERFVANPFQKGSLLYRTGDLVRWRSDGLLEFIGRLDNQVKIRGYRVELGEIESVLLQHPAVRQAVVLAREDTPGDRRLVCYVVGDRNAAVGDASGGSRDALRETIVDEWEALYGETYESQKEVVEPSFVGWNSSYTGQPIPEAQMKEWLAATVERIRGFAPNRVLEIGCGVGLLVQHLAPNCRVYVGTDFSKVALDQLKSWIKRRADLGHVELLHRAATELSDLKSASFDTVILNSVVQYFPDVEYLLAVLREAVRVVGPGGRVFVGDVRHFGLLRTFHSAVQLGKAAATVTVEQLRHRIARAVGHDKELVIDPDLFRGLPGNLPGVSAAEIHLKRGHSHNELTRHRYDVTLEVGRSLGVVPVCKPLDWQQDVGSLEAFEAALKERRWAAVELRGIPNRRLAREIAAQHLIETSEPNIEVGALRLRLNLLRLEEIDPESIWQLAEGRGYHAAVKPGQHGRFDVRLIDRARSATVRSTALPVREVASWFAYANDPLESGFRHQLISTLREYLRKRLPEYMVPSAWIALKQLPLTPNGKVDRRALPAPQGRPEELGEYVAPRTPLEHTLAEIWADVLRVDQVGVFDNFFELGGHSLLIVQLMERLRRLGLFTTVRSVYESPTVEALARKLTSGRDNEGAVPPNLIPVDCEAITPEMLTLVKLKPEHIAHITSTVPGGVGNVQDIYPLAPLQEGMLFHHVLNRDGGDAYARSILLETSSRERLDAFVAALEGVIDHHDILRTAVLWEHLPQPVQVVYRKAKLCVEEITLDGKRDAVEQLKDNMKLCGYGLDLRRAPMLKLLIAADHDGQKWYAILQTHHLVFDNESLHTMLLEVVAHVSGRSQDLSAPVPYRNHVAQACAASNRPGAEEFFRRKLEGIEEPTAPFGLIDVHGDGSRIQEVYQPLDQDLSRQVRAHARRLRVSAATLFHAAWALVVARTSGRDDVVFGSVLSGRMQGRAGAGRALGMFINTLPLRLRLKGITVAQLVEQTQKDLVELLDYEQTSLALAQRCSSLSGTLPLFSSLLNYMHSAVDLEAEFAATPGIRFVAARGGTNYPVTLLVDGRGEGFVLGMKTESRIDPRRMIGYVSVALQSLVDALETDAQVPAMSLTVLPARERRQIVEVFNSTQVPYPEEKLIHELFEGQVERNPDAVAVVQGSRALTYAELNARANRLARYLRRRGVGPDRLVALYLERSVEMIVGMLAVLKAGGAYLPLDRRNPAARLEYLLADSSPGVLLTVDRLRNARPSSRAEVIVMDREWGDIAKEDPGNLDPRAINLTPSHLAYVIYTSGSTGKPKGVMVEHRNVVNYVVHAIREFDVKSGDGSIVATSFSFDLMLTGLYPPLLAGRTVRLCPEVQGVPDIVGELLQSSRLAPLKVTPSHLPLLEGPLREGRLAGRIRCLVVGGEPLAPSAVALWRKHAPSTRVFNHYGPTEATIGSIVHECHDESGAIVPVGRPISNTQVYILDSSMQPVPIGVAGEICIGGAGVARGYLNQPQLTAERFVPDPFSSNAQARLYKTGDIGRWRADGEIEYLGRNDQQVKVRGFRIELQEIEAEIAHHPEIKQVIVIVRADTAGDKRLVAYIVPNDPSRVNDSFSETLLTELKAKLPDYMIPSALVLLECLPVTSNGKLDRGALPAPEYVSGHYEAPCGETEQALADILQTLLGIRHVGRNDDFFKLGGHSLLAMRLIGRIAERFAVVLPVVSVFRYPTLRHLAAAVESLRLMNAVASAEEEDVEEGEI